MHPWRPVNTRSHGAPRAFIRSLFPKSVYYLDGSVSENSSALGPYMVAGGNGTVSAALCRTQARDVGSLACKLNEERLNRLATGLDVYAIVKVVLERVSSEGDVAHSNDVQFARVRLEFARLLLVIPLAHALAPVH